MRGEAVFTNINSAVSRASAGSHPLAAEWEPFCLTERMIFPSALISLATYELPEEDQYDSVLGDQTGLMGIAIAAPEKDTDIEVTLTCESIMEPSVFKGKLPAGGKDDVYHVLPKIRYRFDALVTNKRPGRQCQEVRHGRGAGLPADPYLRSAPYGGLADRQRGSEEAQVV